MITTDLQPHATAWLNLTSNAEKKKQDTLTLHEPNDPMSTEPENTQN